MGLFTRTVSCWARNADSRSGETLSVICPSKSFPHDTFLADCVEVPGLGYRVVFRANIQAGLPLPHGDHPFPLSVLYHPNVARLDARNHGMPGQGHPVFSKCEPQRLENLAPLVQLLRK